MIVKQLYDRLVNVYTFDNLTKITSNIVTAYREKNYSYIHKLKLHLKGFITSPGGATNRLFAQLIMLYHPDRLGYYQKEMHKQLASDSSRSADVSLPVRQRFDVSAGAGTGVLEFSACGPQCQ